jgi:hypothetical protein
LLLKQIDTYRKNCLWSRGEINRRGKCLIAWEVATKPRDQGGLGIIDIKSQNNALLMKFLDKFYNKADIPWVTLTWTKLYSNTQTPPQAKSPVGSFWWKEVMQLFGKFGDITICSPNRGNSAFFWSEAWSGAVLKDQYPHLFSFTKKPKCSIRFFLDQEPNRVFSLPLSTQAAAQLDEVHDLL